MFARIKTAFLSAMISLLLIGLTAKAADPSEAERTAAIARHIAILKAEPKVLERVSGNRKGYDSPGIDAALALMKIGSPALKPLDELIRDESPTVRLNAIWTIRGIGGLDANFAIAPAVDDREPNVRIAAVSSLDALSYAKILDLIIARLHDDEPSVRLAAIRRLAIQTKSFKDHPSNTQVNYILKALDESTKSPDSELRIAAVQTLASYRTANALPQLIKMIDDRSDAVRAAVAMALGRTRTKQALDPLLKILDNEREADLHSIEVVRNAIASLGELEDPRAVDRLVELLDHRDLQARVAAIRALGHIGDRRAVPPLLPLLGSDLDGMPSIVATALGELGDVRAVEPLIAALSAKDEQDRAAIMLALGKFNDARAIGSLVHELFRTDVKSTSPIDAAEAALAKIRDPGVVRALAERSVASPTSDGGFRARRLIGKLVDREFRFDPDGLAAWWKEESRRK